MKKSLCWGAGVVLSFCSTCIWGEDTGKRMERKDSASEMGSQTFSEKDHPVVNTDTNPDTLALPEYVVFGKRASLMSAQEIKREKIEIVDSVVADDINNLPDTNVTDSLQRISGVQILRDRGEGAGVAIRGLTQMETTLNGREVFTAGWGRNFDFADAPAELVAGIDVYKTPSADHIEGGIGGQIDLRTRRPFDYDDDQIVGTVRETYGDLAQRFEPQYSALLSSRWDTADSGEFGFLLNAVKQRRGWREDQKITGSPLSRDDIISGQTIVVPNGTSETTSIGLRERTAASAMLQWRPSHDTELYAEASYAKLKTIQDSYQINVSASPTFVAGTPVLFPGTNDLQSITWTDAPASALSFARDTTDETKQAAIGGSWSGRALSLNTDLSYTKSHNYLFFSGLLLGSTAAEFSHDLSTSIPSTRISGTNLLDPSNFQFANVLYRTRPFDGELSAGRLDGEYLLNGDFFDSLHAGVRLARRHATDSPGLIFADANTGAIPATSMPEFITTNPYDDFLPGSTSIGSYLVGDISSARDATALRDSFGISDPIPESNPLGIWDIDERTQAAYLMANVLSPLQTLDGNIGMRVVRTHETVKGNQNVPSSNTIVPINVNNVYLDYLPSVNLRYQLQDGLYLRASVSKTITRPNFDLLSPSLTLVRNLFNPELNQGGAGNPELKPVRSNNLDLALERYFNPTTSVHLTGFLKKVDGFVTMVSNPELHDGEVYQVSRPQNSEPADIKGAEIGYQQFYDFLPGWFSGLGLQLNYTYIDSETLNNTLGEAAPLQNLSKHSYNIIAMYEKAKVSARIAYNWRDKYLSSVANIVGVGAVPVYTKAYGWMDASFRYQFNDAIAVTLEGLNLLRTRRESYYGVETRPQSYWLNDRIYSAAVTAQF